MSTSFPEEIDSFPIQSDGGSVMLPEALRHYFGGDRLS